MPFLWEQEWVETDDCVLTTSLSLLLHNQRRCLLFLVDGDHSLMFLQASLGGTQRYLHL